MRRRWGVAVLPTALGLVVASLVADVVTLPNPIIRVRVDLGTLSVVAGVMLSILVWLIQVGEVQLIIPNTYHPLKPITYYPHHR